METIEVNGVVWTYDQKQSKDWLTKIVWEKEGEIEVSSNIKDGEEIRKRLQADLELIKKLHVEQVEIKSQIADDMLELHNDTWNESEEPITKEEFMNRINCEWISIFEDQTVTIGYDDGDLFWGHAIVADINQKQKVIRTNLFG